MVLVKSVQGLCSDDFWGKLGVSCGFGLALLGTTQMGDNNDRAGIYSHKHTRKGRKISKMRSYAPTNNQLTNQQYWRNIFKNGINAWNALDNEQRQAYNDLKYPTAPNGHIRFMKKYLIENR